MIEVQFHTSVADPVGFACRLLRKAYRKGARVLVTAPAPTLAALDRELWTFEELEFVPHARLTGATNPALAARTPIWLVDGAPPPDAPDVLINVGAAAPAQPASYARIIEIVGDDPGDAQAGRERWRGYRALGATVTHHAAGRV